MGVQRFRFPRRGFMMIIYWFGPTLVHYAETPDRGQTDGGAAAAEASDGQGRRGGVGTEGRKEGL